MGRFFKQFRGVSANLNSAGGRLATQCSLNLWFDFDNNCHLGQLVFLYCPASVDKMDGRSDATLSGSGVPLNFSAFPARCAF
jgi:hypothetical protein